MPEESSPQGQATTAASDPAPTAGEGRQLWFSIAAQIRLLILLVLVLVVATCLWLWVFEQQWLFNVQARTDIVSIKTPALRETRWRTDGAVVCVRGRLPETAESARLPPQRSPCKARRWNAYQFSDPEQALVLMGSYSVAIELEADNSLVLALRQADAPLQLLPPDGESANGESQDPPDRSARLVFTRRAADIALDGEQGINVNLVWRSDPRSGVASADKIFPFVGQATIGRDVNWAGGAILQEGEVDVFTSDESSDGRKKVENSSLVMGDQVRLDVAWNGDTPIPPKGFVRYTQDAASGVARLDVIAFGAADRLRIERYGDNGYDFQPGPLTRILNDSLLLLILSTLSGFLAVWTSLHGLFGKSNES